MSSPNDQLLLQVAELLQQKRKVEAVTLYRETKKVSAFEAQVVIDTIEHELQKQAPKQDNAMVTQIKDLLRQKRKIEAVKIYREATGLGLKESKDFVDAVERGESPMPHATTLSKSSSGGSLVDQVREALRRGNKIEAVKIYKDATGLGLKESKDFVDALERGEMPTMAAMPIPTFNGAPSDWMAQVKAQLRKGNKIEAIKIYREATGLGLKEAKEAVEALERSQE
jgi:ribosomal protein L7/L12